MHLIKTEIYRNDPSSPTTAWVEPKTTLQKALADDIIEVSSWKEGVKVVSSMNMNLPPEVLGYEHTYCHITLKGNNEQDKDCYGCILPSKPRIEQDVSKKRILEILKDFPTIEVISGVISRAFQSETSKFSYDDYYWEVSPGVVYNRSTNTLTTDPAIVKRVATNKRKREKERAKVSTNDLKELLKEVNTVWEVINLPCIDTMTPGRMFCATTFSDLCDKLPLWVELANHMQVIYSWKKLRKWPKLAKRIWNSDEQLSNEVYAYGLQATKNYNINQVKEHVFDLYIDKLKLAYACFLYPRSYSRTSAYNIDHPKGVQDGINRVYALIEKKQANLAKKEK
jgi:hypothetical protein